MNFRNKAGRRVAKALTRRASQPRVGDRAPSAKRLRRYVAAAANVPDHSSLHPWRLIALRGDARLRLGKAIAAAQGDREPSLKPLRAPLLIAVVASLRPDRFGKVPRWEQQAVAVEVVHGLQLLLQAEGWGSFWRTGRIVEADAVREFHGLGPDEQLLGWLYVGERTQRPKLARPARLRSTALTEIGD